jgi:hypothetical protein
MCCANEKEVGEAYGGGRCRSGGRGDPGCRCGCRECQCCGCCSCGCEDLPFGFRRKFTSRSERLEELERYLAELEAEGAGVREQIADLKAAGG